MDYTQLTAQARQATEELLEAAHLETGNCWQRFNDPVLVEEVRAAAGMDIGGTLIGMHLRRVAVPVRLSMDHIGQAILLCARTRPPFIGGSRAVYSQEEVR